MSGTIKIREINDAELQELGRLEKEAGLREEGVLRYYCLCMLKLYRAYTKIEKTELLSYIYQIVTPAFLLVLKHFLKQAKIYMMSGEMKDKALILQDIELSVESFCNVWEAVIQSTNGADRILIQSAPLEAGIRQIPVKLCAYYTSLLNDLANLFHESEEREYAFLVYPSLGSLPEAELLFLNRCESGKVGIIRVPEKDIKNIKYLRMLICHEFYHIVPGSKIRLRRSRAVLFAKILLYDLRERLLNGINVTESERDRLEYFLFSDALDDLKENYINNSAEDRSFYSTTILNEYSNYFTKCILQLLEKDSVDLWEMLYQAGDFDNFAKYKKSKDRSERYLQRIFQNIFKILANSEIAKACKFYSDIFREVFADLLYVLNLQVLPKEYLSTFRYRPVGEEDFIQRPGIYLRVCLVIETMTAESTYYLNEELHKNWVGWRHEYIEGDENIEDDFIKEIKNFMFDIFTSSKNMLSCDNEALMPEKDAVYVKTIPDKNIWKHYVEYFCLCRKEYQKFEEGHSREIQMFREKYLIGTEDSDMEILVSISKREQVTRD